MKEVTAGVYLVSINRSRYSAVYGGGSCKNGFPSRGRQRTAAHQRQRRHGLKKESATFPRLRRIYVLDEYVYLSIACVLVNQLGAPWPLFDQCGGFWASLSVRFRLHVERSTFCSPFTLLRNECHVLNVVNFVLFNKTKSYYAF